MYYMLKDIVKTLEAALPLGLLAGALIFVLKRYVFKIDKPKLYAVCEIAFWAYVFILLYRTVIGRAYIRPAQRGLAGVDNIPSAMDGA